METILRIGGDTMSLTEARKVTFDYLVTHAGSTSAYPAYDGFMQPTGPQIVESDLLSIALLNALQSPIPVFYALQKIAPELNRILARIPLNESLLTATDETLEHVAQLADQLHPDGGRPVKHLSLVRLSKVLHRKRPHLIPLFDENVRICYSSVGNPVRLPPDKERSWGDFTRAWLPLVREDLEAAATHWDELAALAPGPSITPLRALDIVAWTLGGRRRIAIKAN